MVRYWSCIFHVGFHFLIWMGHCMQYRAERGVSAWDGFVDKKLSDGVWCFIVQQRILGFCCFLSSMLQMNCKVLTIEEALLFGIGQMANNVCIRLVAIINKYLIVAFLGIFWPNHCRMIHSKYLQWLPNRGWCLLSLICHTWNWYLFAIIFLLWLVLLWMTCSVVVALHALWLLVLV